MTDDSFRLALRHRLGLLPYDALAKAHCANPCCTKDGGKALFTTDPDHFHSCHAYKRSSLTVRHNNLVHVLMRLARSVGFYASHEPSHHQRPQQAADNKLTDGWNDHADILLVKHDRRLYVDVTVTRPTTSGRLSKPTEAAAVLTTPLYSCRQPANRKHALYDEIATLNGYEMIPFVVETYGGLAPEARALLRTLSSHAEDTSEREWLRHAQRCISIALQSGNAFVAQTGMQQQHTAGVRQTSFQVSQGKYERRRRRAPRAPVTRQSVVAVTAQTDVSLDRARKHTTAHQNTASRNPTPATMPRPSAVVAAPRRDPGATSKVLALTAKSRLETPVATPVRRPAPKAPDTPPPSTPSSPAVVTAPQRDPATPAGTLALRAKSRAVTLLTGPVRSVSKTSTTPPRPIPSQYHTIAMLDDTPRRPQRHRVPRQTEQQQRSLSEQ